jgi:ABC-type phosphate transport system substrate-binding protein
VALAAVATAVLGLAVSVVSSGPSSAQDSSTTLLAEGGSFELNLMDKLQADSTSVIAPLAPGFFDANVDTARDDFASGLADYAVSEFPLTTAQAATAAQNHRTFAYVPFAASAVAIGAVVECSNDQTFTSHTLCEDLQLTVVQLAKIFTYGITQWNDPSLSQVSGGGPAQVTDVSKTISPQNEIDPSASNYALASMFVNDPTAKVVWDAFLKTNKVTDDTPTDKWPTGRGGSGGDLTLANSLVQVNETTGLPQTNPSLWGQGSVAPLPADWLGPPRNILTSDPTTNMTVAIQNAAGKYVLPTVDATTAAVNDATFDSSTNLVTFNSDASDAAAYPIDVMSYLIVPTSGLSAAKATALASFIKWVLGPTGQADVKSLGDAPVTTAMVNAGMKVADEVSTQTSQTSTPTTTTTTTTTTTPSAVTTGATGSGSSTDLGSSGSGATGSSTGTSPTLAYTGGLPAPLIVAGSGLLMVGALLRRAMRRRITCRGSEP